MLNIIKKNNWLSIIWLSYGIELNSFLSAVARIISFLVLPLEIPTIVLWRMNPNTELPVL